jgi:subtilisin family serine protease
LAIFALATMMSQTGWASEGFVDIRSEGESLRGEAAGLIDTRLVVLAAQESRRAFSPDRLPVGENELRHTDTSFLHRMGDGSVGIRITSANPGELVAPLEALGATHITAVPSAYLVDFFLPVDRIGDLTSLAPMGMRSATAMAQPLSMVGAATSQADSVMEADRVRAATPGYDGAGVRVGILSDSFNGLGGAPAGVASGDLPATVQVIEDVTSGFRTDEGRAMMELMYDLAPGADYAFAAAMISEARFAQNVERLADPATGNCRVIVDDILYYAEPYYQNSLVGRAINKVVSEHDVVYFSAAGNSARNAWERIEPETASDPDFPGVFIDFDPGPGIDTRQGFELPAVNHLYISLQWDDPFYTLDGVDTDIDIIILKDGVHSSTIATNNLANQTPMELFFVTSGNAPATVELMFRVTSGPAPGRMKYVNYIPTTSGEHLTHSPTVASHAGAEGSISVGAIDFFDQTSPRDFTSVGPSTQLFDDAGNRIPGGIVRETPTLSAIQNTDTSFFKPGNDPDSNGYPNFQGTSAAAPHAAAVAALILQHDPDLTRDEVLARLIAACDDSIGEPGYDNVTGHGSLNAFRAVFGDPVTVELPVVEDLASGGLPVNWATHSTNNGRLVVTDDHEPMSGLNHLVMDAYFTDVDSLNTATLLLNLEGQSNVELRFTVREFTDDDHPMPAEYVGLGEYDGVAYSIDGGTTWKRITSLTGEDVSDSPTEKVFDLSALTTANGDVLGSEVHIRFQQFGLNSIPDDGIAFENIIVNSSIGVLSFDVDTDGDGYSDGYEQARGSDPKDEESRPSPLLGDINSDNVVDAADVAALASAIVNSSLVLTVEQAGIVDDADTNQITDDTVINVSDVTRLGQYVNGQVEILR